MSAAVVVPTRDRHAQLAEAVAAIRAVLRPSDELVVVDSGSRSPVVLPGVRVVRLERPGAARARNAGAAVTTADVIAFTDDDCRPQPGWVDALVATFDRDERVGVVAGRVAADADGRRFVLSVSADATPRTFVAGDDPAGVAHGANLAFRRGAFDAIGGFDERFGPGATFRNGEDYDAFFRVLAGGWRGAYEPAAVVSHVQWRSAREAVAAYYRYGVGDGAFAVKARRPHLLRRRLWSDGARRVARDVASGNESAAVADAAKTAGVVVGAVRAAFVRWR